MKQILVDFVYHTPDEVHYSDWNGKIGRLEYSGPSHLYLEVDKDSEKLTGRQFDQEYYQSFERNEEDNYVIEVDCSKNPLVCELFENTTQEGDVEQIEEEIPGNIEPFVHDIPVLPQDIYNVREIEYDIQKQKFTTPFPWIEAPVDWTTKLAKRDIDLAVSDKHLSEDLPANLYKQVEEYRRFLRNMPEVYGVAWQISIDEKGSGYAVGDRISINDPRYKNNENVNEILLEIKKVDSEGGITDFKKLTKAHALYHPEKGTYQDVFYITNSKGSGASFSFSKNKTVDPWKVNYGDSPLER